jgi:hypothetical protein
MQKTTQNNYQLTYHTNLFVTQDNIIVFKKTLRKFRDIEEHAKKLIAEKENAGKKIQLPEQIVFHFDSKSRGPLEIDLALIREYLTELSKLKVNDCSIKQITRKPLIPITGEEVLSSQRSLHCTELYPAIVAICSTFDIPFPTTDQGTASHSGYLREQEEAIEQDKTII